MALNMFAKVTRVDSYFRREAEQLCILKITDKLLIAMPRTRPGAEIYLRVYALEYAEDLSDNVWRKSAELMVAYYPDFEDYIQDIRPAISAISACQCLNSNTFSWSVAPILYRSAKLPQVEYKRIRKELHGALAAIAQYFSRPDVVALADHLTQNDDWICFRWLSEASVELAKVHKDVFLQVPEIVDALERVSSMCPNDEQWKERIQNNLKTLRELTGLQSHPYVSHCACH